MPPLPYRVLHALYASAGRLSPVERRYAMVLASARVLAPLQRQYVRFVRRTPPRLWTTPREAALSLGLGMLDASGLLYMPQFEATGMDLFEAARQRGKGVLVVATHTGMSQLLIRLLYDVDPSVLMVATRPLAVPGRQVISTTLIRSRMLLLNARTGFRSGETIAAMIDRPDPHERGNVPVYTRDGATGLSTGLLSVAARSGAAILFACVKVDDEWRLRATIAQPTPDVAGQPEAIAREFAVFMQRQYSQTPVSAPGQPSAVRNVPL